MQRPSHPSGRPIRPRVVKSRPIWRIPDIEPNVPRLRRGNQRTEAVGFVHHFEREDSDWVDLGGGKYRVKVRL